MNTGQASIFSKPGPTPNPTPDKPTNLNLADRLIQWIGTREVVQGPLAGQPLKVLKWERRFIKGAFADGISLAGLSIGRGNGKSAFLGTVGAACIAGPLAQRNGEAISVSGSHDQAAIIFSHVLNYLEEELRAGGIGRTGRYSVNRSVHKKAILDRHTGACFRCISSDPKHAHGLAPVLLLLDEPSSWKQSVSEEMYGVLATSLGKVENARLIALGTRPSDPGHWFQARIIDRSGERGIYAQAHAIHPDDNPFLVRSWRKANPSLDHMPTLRRQIETEAELAKTDAGMLQTFLALRCNAGVPDAERGVPILPVEAWMLVESDVLPPRDAAPIWGVDLGEATSMSAVAAAWDGDCARLEVLAAFPKNPNLAERALADGVGQQYKTMAERGELLTLGDRTVDYGQLIHQALLRFGRPAKVLADRYHAAQLREALEAEGLGDVEIEYRGNAHHKAEDLRAFKEQVLRRSVKTPKSILMRHCLAEARQMQGSNGYPILAVRSEAGRRRRSRDDALAAALLALGALSRSEYVPEPKVVGLGGG